MKAAKADFWSGLALGGLGAYIIVQASRWEYLGADGPGPGLLPAVVRHRHGGALAGSGFFKYQKPQF